MTLRQEPEISKTIKEASKSKTNMLKNLLRGIFFCAMWYLSIIAGFFLLVCPILPLVFISPKKYRKWSDRIFGMWEPFPVAIMEVCFGIRVVLSGDQINPFEGSLFIMNHRTRVDWNFLWLGLYHCCKPNAHNMKCILKIPIMRLPGAGWVMQTCSFIFLHRNWCKDMPLLNNILDYLNESDSLYQILLFPEGTDLTEKNLNKSHKYAEENNLAKYYKVLHPKTTGFAFITNKMKSGGQLKAVYDVTIAYPKTMPMTEFDLLRGKFPEEVHFNVKRYSSSNLPQEEEELKSWLNNIWKEKEEKLQKFYVTGSFTSEAAYNLTDEDIDFGRMSIKNGVIKYEAEGRSSKKEMSLVSISKNELKSLESTKLASSIAQVIAEEEAPQPSRSQVAEPQPSNSAVAEDPPQPSKSVIAEEDPPQPSETAVAEEPPQASKSVVAEEEPPQPSQSTMAKAQQSSAMSSQQAAKGASVVSKAPSGGSKKSSKEAPVAEVGAPSRSQVSCEDMSRSTTYRPSHLLYLVLFFWITLIILTLHQLYYNFYLQIWVLTHSLLFTALSFVSNGFHHLVAQVYFYRYGRKPCSLKKSQ